MSRRTTIIVAVGLAVCLLLGGAVSYFASASPDGLNKVATEQGFADTEEQSSVDGSPVAGYETRGVDEGWLSGGIAGVTGVGLTFLTAAGLVLIVRRRQASDADAREKSRDER
jgi:cobalt/nickel transport system permease protein/cobalt/nickel transport protein